LLAVRIVWDVPDRERVRKTPSNVFIVIFCFGILGQSATETAPEKSHIAAVVKATPTPTQRLGPIAKGAVRSAVAESSKPDQTANVLTGAPA